MDWDHYSVCGGSGYCSLTIDVSLGQTNWSTCETDGLVSCWLIVSWSLQKRSLEFRKSEGKLAQVSVLVPDQLMRHQVRVSKSRKGRKWWRKKSQMQQRYLNVTSDDLWCIRDKLAGKKSSLGKTYKTNREANDKVYELNQQASKYVETLALLYANFERICAEKKEVEEQFARDFDESLKMLSESRSRCTRVAETYARIEDDLNEGMKVIRNHFRETATAPELRAIVGGSRIACAV